MWRSILTRMNSLVINIDWQWALGILGALLLLAWAASRKFSKVETDITWLKEGFKDIKLAVDNLSHPPFFKTGSPVNLTQKGSEFLKDSGLQKYIDDRRDEFIGTCSQNARNLNSYDLQNAIFDFFDTYRFEPEVDKALKEAAYKEGISMDMVRRIGAIYFRKICFKQLKMDEKELDAAGGSRAS